MKVWKKGLTLAMALGMLASTAACGSKGGGGMGLSYSEEPIDENRKQIYVSAYNGGYGLDWLYSLKSDFEADNPEYQLMIISQKNDPKTLVDIISSGNSTYHIYVQNGSEKMKQLIDRDCLVDMSDIFNEKAEESDTMTIKQKMVHGDLQQETYSRRDGSGIYMFPYTMGLSGIIFDYDTFVENNWLEYAAISEKSAIEGQGIVCHEENGQLIFDSSTSSVNYEAGDKILKTGRDGKYGTYDDGQPTTLADFEFMLAKIRSGGKYNPFIYSTQQPGYHEQLLMSIFATYEGMDNFELYYSFDGTYSRTGERITYDNGYKVYEMEGFKLGAQFMHDYVTRTNSYAETVVQNISFTEAQNNFLLGYMNSGSIQGAMIIEGPWWENEAKGTFEALGKRDAARGYGKRDYRYLIYPEFEGQLGIDGTGKGTYITPLEEGVIAIDKNTPADLLEACKEVVKYTCRDKYLLEIMKVGGYRPYKFNVSEEQKAQLTPYCQNLFEMTSDTENIGIVPVSLMKENYDLSFYGIGSETNRTGGIFSSSYFFNDKSKTVDDYLNMVKNVNQDNWQSYIAKMNSTLNQ